MFGGGIGGTERLCGVAAGAIFVIALKYSDGMARNSAEMKERSAAYMKDFIEHYSGDLCKDIKPVHFKGDTRCLAVVLEGFDMLEKHMK